MNLPLLVMRGDAQTEMKEFLSWKAVAYFYESTFIIGSFFSSLVVICLGDIKL
jgi:hypothetical protein